MANVQMAWNENHISLVGLAGGPAVLSHENHGVSYFQFPLRVSRLSGVEDVLNIVAAEPLLRQTAVEPGVTLAVEGEVRSYNNRSGTGSKLVITVYARTLEPGDGPHKNELTLAGVLCKPTVVRRTPLGREICDMMLAVNRKYGRADYLPCIAWGGLAAWCGQLEVGDGLKLNGRLQSREYTKEENGESVRRTAFEVSVMSLEPVERDT
ncbi:MAG: single-stranded DNA-binding protein [Oscillospiraceae bacterium]